jgi:c-di-GMP-related signal transduction protein
MASAHSGRSGSTTPAAGPATHGERVMIGRQPIFNRKREVIGYELLVESAETPEGGADPGDAAARIIAGGLLASGLDRLVSGRRAFVELPPALAGHDVTEVLPPSRVVLEVSCQGKNDDLVRVCQDLKAHGYSLALKDFSPDAADLLALADFVTSDIAAVDSRERQASLDTVRSSGKRAAAIAKGVDTVEVLDAALREGFTHAEGYFFAADKSFQATAIPRGQVGHLKLLHALNDRNLSLNDLEDLLKHDASLCFRLLRTVNSAAFAQTREITSIRQALLLVGLDTIRRWASLWLLVDLGASAHGELVTMASVRGRFCELMWSRKFGDDLSGEGFLLGMCSCLDVILQTPMDAILEELPVSIDVSAALRGRPNTARLLLDCILTYERGQWTASRALASELGVDIASLPQAHAQALDWAGSLRNGR